MEYVLENEQIKLTVSSHGAEPVSVIAKKTVLNACGMQTSLYGAATPPFFFPTPEN